ncbi:MAG: response regulator [Crocinitomicaceae bacterium]|nr:response regulator [Crocinitomicaceae bacterium]
MKQTIFILEDSSLVANLVKHSLEETFNCEVSIFFTERELMLNMLRKPALVILDYHLEDNKTGMEALINLRKFDPKLPVVFFSGQTLIHYTKLVSEHTHYVDKNNDDFLSDLIKTCSRELKKSSLKNALDKIKAKQEKSAKALIALVSIMTALSASLFL